MSAVTDRLSEDAEAPRDGDDEWVRRTLAAMSPPDEATLERIRALVAPALDGDHDAA
jgi:hypothetical protein